MTRLLISSLATIICATNFIARANAQTARVKNAETSAASQLDSVPTIFDVRKSLPMEPTEPSYHDFYINAGAEAGFRKGQYLPVQRAIPVHDPVQNKQQAILTIPVGKVVVIHAERGITVARLVTELGDEDRPTLEYEAIMIGDRIDMKGITTEAPKDAGKKRKKIVETQTIPVTPIAVPAPAALDVVVEKLPANAPIAPGPVPTSPAPAAPAASSAPSSSPPAASVPAPSGPSAVNTPTGQPASGPSTSTPSATTLQPSPSSPTPRVTQVVRPPTA